MTSLCSTADWRCLLAIKMRWVEKEGQGVAMVVAMVVARYLDIVLNDWNKVGIPCVP